MKLKKPTLLIKQQQCEKNIEKMKEKAGMHELQFRPHFKTHQNSQVGAWFQKRGIDTITVSSVEMATFFARQGFGDITIAFPLNIHEIEEMDQLAGKLKLSVLIENVEVLKSMSTLSNKTGVFIKIDAGYHRTGISWRDTEYIDTVLSLLEVNDKLSFKGFVAHFGNTYSAKGKDAVAGIYHQSMEALIKLKNKYQQSYPEILLSIGDTPSCSLLDQFEGVDEIRPGNFVYYDLMQWQIGSCEKEEIAVCVASPLVAKHADRHEVVIYGGAVHLSKEYITMQKEKIYGWPVLLTEGGWKFLPESNFVSRLSQEHGIVKMDAELMSELNIGDFLGIIPVHSCLTANLMKDHYLII